ncbi:MAG: hypothetical protein EXR69_00470 [Myxococcales bacterium]|nr:hypothetical protein [Myxococcales bacterium]
MATGPRIIARLIEHGGFDRAFGELQGLQDRGLYAELLSGATWSPGRSAAGRGDGAAEPAEGAADHVTGSFQPGRAFARRGLQRGALDALLLFLVTEAEGPVAAELRESAVSLRLAHFDGAGRPSSGGPDLRRLSLLPNLRALALNGLTAGERLPALRLDRLELVSTVGVTQSWLDHAAPSDFWTDADYVPQSVVRLRLNGTAGTHPPIVHLALLEELHARWCSTLHVRACPRLRRVWSIGPLDVASLATWGDLPQLESLRAEGAFGWVRPSPISLSGMPKLRTLVLDGFVDLLCIPSSVTHLGASLADLSPLATLARPVELRLPRAGGDGRLPPLRDASALTILDLSGRDLGDTALNAIRSFSALHQLYLRGTPITSVEPLRGHPSLGVVDISDCTLLRDVHALGTLPNLKVTLMAGACAMTPADLPSAVEWTASRQTGPNIDALLHRDPPTPAARRLPRALPKRAERLFLDVFPLMLRRDYDSIDVAIDEFAHAEIPEVWDWWLDGVDPPGSPRGVYPLLSPRRMSQTQRDQPFARHAALRLIARAPDTCEIAARYRLETTLQTRFYGGPGGCFDLSLLAGLPQLESVVVGCNELKLPGCQRPDWVPRLTSLHVVNYMTSRENPRSVERRLRAVLPHVPDIIVR